MLLAGFLSERFDHSDILQKSLKSTAHRTDRKSTRLNSSHGYISYAVFCLKKKKRYNTRTVSLSHCVRIGPRQPRAAVSIASVHAVSTEEVAVVGLPYLSSLTVA